MRGAFSHREDAPLFKLSTLREASTNIQLEKVDSGNAEISGNAES